MTNRQAGKGDQFRPVNKKRFDRNYTYIFGVDCKNCNGTGKVRVIQEGKQWHEHPTEDCPFCDGLGRVDKHGRK